MTEGTEKGAARLTMEEIDQLPALISTREYARITGETPLYVAKLCKAGSIDAVRRGRKWLIPKAKALEALGLS